MTECYFCDKNANQIGIVFEVIYNQVTFIAQIAVCGEHQAITLAPFNAWPEWARVKILPYLDLVWKVHRNKPKPDTSIGHHKHAD